MFNTDPGGQPLIRSDVTRGVASARKFAAVRDLPDVLGFEDFAHAAEATYELALRRVSAGVAFTDATPFPLSKGDGHATRPMTVMNPLDELALRAFVGRCSMAIRAATDPTRSLNGLIERPGPGWYPKPFSNQFKRRRQLREEYFNRPDVGAVGFFDAKEFFPNCGHATAGALLDGAGAPAGAVEFIVKALGMMFPSGLGLPIGFEGSGPIANLFFREVDAQLAAMGIPSLRWTDDLDTFLRDVTVWPGVYEMVETTLLTVGIQLNLDKTGVEDKASGRAAERLFDPSRDSIFQEDDPVAAAEDRIDTSLWFEEAFGIVEEPSPVALRSQLRALMRKASPAALPFLQARPHWLDREPKAVGNYLRTVAADCHAKSDIDLDWLMDRAVGRTPTQQTAAGQMHACRALAAYRVDKVEAKTLSEFASGLAERREYVPLGAWATRAWAESRGWKRQVAMHLIDDVDHQGYRRAAVMGFAGTPAGHRDCHLDTIAGDHAELRPVVELVRVASTVGSALP